MLSMSLNKTIPSFKPTAYHVESYISGLTDHYDYDTLHFVKPTVKQWILIEMWLSESADMDWSEARCSSVVECLLMVR